MSARGADTGGITWDRPDTDALGLTGVMALMRARCPWAAAHTHASLEKYLLEEAYELLAALRTADAAEIVGELGDVLYQVIFHAALLDEERGLEEGSSMAEVEAVLKAKLIRRHPHVFASDHPVPIEEVERRYEEIKAAERAEKAGAQAVPAEDSEAAAAAAAAASFASVPASMPALARADAILGRCERLGIAPVAPDGDGAGAGETAGAREGERDLAVRLFELVARAHADGIDPEAALRGYTAALERATADANGPGKPRALN